MGTLGSGPEAETFATTFEGFTWDLLSGLCVRKLSSSCFSVEKQGQVVPSSPLLAALQETA